MAWWNRSSKPEDEIPIKDPSVVKLKFGDSVRSQIIEAKPGQVITVDDPKEVVIAPKDPEPDLSTKPKDVVGYCFGYVCPKKHVQQPFESITLDGYKERRACQTCGGVSKPATVRRTAEPRWEDTSIVNIFERNPNPSWGWTTWQPRDWPWSQTWWTKYEFVHYLESPKRRKK